MTSSDFIKQVFLIGLLIVVSTGLSFFDKESRFNKLNQPEIITQNSVNNNINTNQIQKVQTAQITDELNADDTNYSPGGGIAEEILSNSTPYIEKESNPTFLPIRDWNIKDPEIGARAALIYDPREDRILYQKNIYQPLPIASLTKLVTAIVITENLELDEVVRVSKNAVMTESEAGNLIVGEEITVENLLYAMLVESSNDAAVALEEYFDQKFPEKNLVELMNEKALKIGLSNTEFKNPSGLDIKKQASNFASAIDLAVLTRYILETNPAILKIISTPFINVFSVDGWHSHYLTSSNELFGVLPEIIGGKTGYTETARESLLLIFKSPSGKEGDLLISIVLGSEDRDGESRVLLKWIKEAYLW